MTDEERAREIASYVDQAGGVRARFMRKVLEAFAVVRADQREQCAEVVEAEAVDEAATHCSDDYAYNDAIEHAAAAIRAMGDKE